MLSNLEEKLKEKQYIITNTDLDGFFSAVALKHIFPHLELGGFANSRDKIWFLDGVVNKQNSVYLDIFMSHKDILCIDNHIIAPNPTVTFNENKINPNILRNRTLVNYYQKYPFGTFVWLIWLFGEKSFPYDFNMEIGDNVKLWELLLRADDALTSTFIYSKNAQDWWNFLLKGNNNIVLKQMYEKLMVNVKDEATAQKIKLKVNNFLKNKFKNISNDGYKDIDIHRKDFIVFFNYLNDMLGHILEYNNDIISQKFIFERVKVTSNLDINTLGQNLVSWAFVSKDLISLTKK